MAVFAYPINDKEQQIGEVRSFSDSHWNKIVSAFGNKMRWVKTETSRPSITETELVSTKKAKRKDKSNE